MGGIMKKTAIMVHIATIVVIILDTPLTPIYIYIYIPIFDPTAAVPMAIIEKIVLKVTAYLFLLKDTIELSRRCSCRDITLKGWCTTDPTLIFA